MENVVLAIHLFIALAIIGLVLIQRSEGGGLGIGGGGGMGRLASPRGTASFLTRVTGICGMAFFGTSLFLGILAGQHSSAGLNILDAVPPVTQEAPATEATTDKAEPAKDKTKKTPEKEPAAPIER